VGEYRGVPEVQHGGATAGYRAFLTRFPEQGVAVAVLCNRADANSGGLAHQVADLWLDGVAVDEDVIAPTPVAVSPDALERLAGAYRDLRMNGVVRLGVRDGGLVVNGQVPMIATAPNTFAVGGGTLVVDGAAPGTRPGFMIVDQAADTVHFEPVDAFDPTPAELEAYAGTWHSSEAEATWTTEVRDSRLVLVDRYGQARPLGPLYPDAFGTAGNVFRFSRDASGAFTGMRWGQGRVWSIRFDRVR
jgi:hypothetical protein